MTNGTPTTHVENVVASCDIGRELALATLAVDLPGVEYNPDAFPGLVYRNDDPSATVLIFQSGKLVCTGARSIADVEAALAAVYDEFRELGIQDVPDPDFEIQNIVSSADLGKRFNLAAVAIGLGLEQVEYEPEQFPGLVYRLDDPDVVALLFGTGKVIITGGTQPDDAPVAVDEVRDRLADLGLVESPPRP